MTKNIITICWSLLCVLGTIYAQTDNRFKRLTSETGLHLQTTLDRRFTANAVAHLGFQTRTGFEFGSDRRFNRIELAFSVNFSKVKGITKYANLNPTISYTHLRKLEQSNFWLGGQLDQGSLLILPASTDFENNPISYTLWLSVGVAARWQRQLQLKQQRVNVAINASLPFLGYVVRPAHAHPYPENYLVDGIFDFERTNLGRYLITSGRIRPLNQFTQTKIKTIAGVPFGKKGHEIGASYQWELLWGGGRKKVWHAQQQLSVFLQINF